MSDIIENLAIKKLAVEEEIRKRKQELKDEEEVSGFIEWIF